MTQGSTYPFEWLCQYLVAISKLTWHSQNLPLIISCAGIQWVEFTETIDDLNTRFKAVLSKAMNIFLGMGNIWTDTLTKITDADETSQAVDISNYWHASCSATKQEEK